MRRTIITFVVMGAMLIMTGCVPSLHPFFTDEKIIFKDALLGAWISDSGEKCLFAKSGEDHYQFLHIDNSAASFEARLTELDGAMFLDLYPQASDYDPGLHLPVHTLARLTIEEDTISIALMMDDWLRQSIDQHDLNLAHERLADGAIVLTAPTRELQSFIKSHANSREAFSEAKIYRRLMPQR
jgi:hypothetical protein